MYIDLCVGIFIFERHLSCVCGMIGLIETFKGKAVLRPCHFIIRFYCLWPLMWRSSMTVLQNLMEYWMYLYFVTYIFFRFLFKHALREVMLAVKPVS